MKKLRLTLSMLSAVVLMAACKKDYTCECSAIVDGHAADTIKTLGKMLSTKAEDECEKFEEQIDDHLSESGIDYRSLSCGIEGEGDDD
jgi:hypothetical protein